jgi:hypothetical protein
MERMRFGDGGSSKDSEVIRAGRVGGGGSGGGM